MTNLTSLLLQGRAAAAAAPPPSPDALFEASLSRVLHHWKSSEFVIITSWRQEKPVEENRANFRALRSRLKEKKYGYVQVEGHGQEEGGAVSQEPALLVVNHRDDQDFLDQMLELANLYEQYGICHARGDGTGAIVLGNGEVDAEFSRMRIAAAQYFTSLAKRPLTAYSSQVGGRNGEEEALPPPPTASASLPRRPFTFEDFQLRRKRPSGFIEGLSRQGSGEGLPPLSAP